MKDKGLHLVYVKTQTFDYTHSLSQKYASSKYEADFCERSVARADIEMRDFYEQVWLFIEALRVYNTPT